MLIRNFEGMVLQNCGTCQGMARTVQPLWEPEASSTTKRPQALDYSPHTNACTVTMTSAVNGSDESFSTTVLNVTTKGTARSNTNALSKKPGTPRQTLNSSKPKRSEIRATLSACVKTR